MITVYWRPGCGYCGGLFRHLEQLGVPHERVDIWSDPDAAALVRSVARGHETVPTVFVGEVPLVNPTAHEVLAVAVEHAPEAVPADYEAPEPGRLSRWIGAKLAGR